MLAGSAKGLPVRSTRLTYREKIKKDLWSGTRQREPKHFPVTFFESVKKVVRLGTRKFNPVSLFLPLSAARKFLDAAKYERKMTVSVHLDGGCLFSYRETPLRRGFPWNLRSARSIAFHLLVCCCRLPRSTSANLIARNMPSILGERGG